MTTAPTRRFPLAIPLLLAALCPATPVAAQQPMGATFRVATSVPSRGGLQSLPGRLITRFDSDDLRGFGMSSPGSHLITGVRMEMEDYDGATAETYSVEIYSEHATQTGFPDIASPIVTVGPFSTPPAAAGRAPFTALIGIPSARVPAGKDVFVGVVLTVANLWPADGLAVDCVLGHASRWTTYDNVGPAPIQFSSYGLAASGSSTTASYNTTRQLVIDLLTATPGGASTAITNQTNYAISNTAPGTGGFLSALHPDARSVPAHPGRADDIGFTYLDTATPDGSPVFFFADFTGFGPELSLAGLSPASRGVFCLPIATVMTLGSGVVTGGQADFFIPVPAAVRPVLAFQPMVMQAIAFDVNTGGANATPCSRRVF